MSLQGQTIGAKGIRPTDASIREETSERNVSRRGTQPGCPYKKQQGFLAHNG